MISGILGAYRSCLRVFDIVDCKLGAGSGSLKFRSRSRSVKKARGFAKTAHKERAFCYTPPVFVGGWRGPRGDWGPDQRAGGSLRLGTRRGHDLCWLHAQAIPQVGLYFTQPETNLHLWVQTLGLGSYLLSPFLLAPRPNLPSGGVIFHPTRMPISHLARPNTKISFVLSYFQLSVGYRMLHYVIPTVSLA